MTDLFPADLSGGFGARAVACVLCGSTPAADVLFYQYASGAAAEFTGPFCRDCGLYCFRRASASTLSAGWWDRVGLVVTPIYLVQNLFRRRRVARLSPPIPTSTGTRPQDPGRPLWRRPAILGLLVPLAPFLALAIAITVAVASDDSDPLVGRCLANGAFVSCHEPHDGEIVAVVDSSTDTCPMDPHYVRKVRLEDGRFACSVMQANAR
jgi:hypothetical protein